MARGEEAPTPNRRTVEEVFRDFRGRRQGLIKALTTDVEKFVQECDPEKDNLCLYGLPNGLWEVHMPVEEVPPELPEPILGINFAKEGMRESDWLQLVAVHSDSWLISLAFYFGGRFKFDKDDRKRLFQMINGLPTVFEVVTGKQLEKLSATRSNGNNTNPSGKMPQSRSSEPQPKRVKMPPPPKEDGDSDEEEEEEEEEADDQESTCCGACGDDNDVDEFWICCDVCEKWFHGKCVKITPAKAEHIKQYKCPICSSKKSRVY